MSSQRVGVSRRRTRRQVIVWTSVAVVISVCAAVLPYLEIRGVAAIPVAQALVPLGALVLLLLAITSLIFRVWAAALVLIVGAVISGVPALTPVHVGEACESDARVTVLSFNAKLAGADPAAIAALIRTTEPDAVMLLEADETLIDAVLTEDGLADVLPYRTHEVTPGPANGSVILSAHPLSLEENIPGASSTRSAPLPPCQGQARYGSPPSTRPRQCGSRTAGVPVSTTSPRGYGRPGTTDSSSRATSTPHSRTRCFEGWRQVCAAPPKRQVPSPGPPGPKRSPSQHSRRSITSSREAPPRPTGTASTSKAAITVPSSPHGISAPRLSL